MTRRPPRRLFDPWDMASLRRAVTARDLLAFCIIGAACAVVPVILFLFDGGE